MSLQEQLKKIGTADLRNVTEKSRRFRPSLLFNAREAADIDLDTIYSIAYNGIMELVILDERFAAFEKTLFSESMKSVDRVLQTAEENAKLDASISAFLHQLSPYFLLKPASKALEWLIRRFRVHEFNVDPVVSCILPYHETKLFAKMVGLLHIKENTHLAFLLPVKKSGIPLERSLLVMKMGKRKDIFDLVCNTVLKSSVPFKILHSFFAATMTEYIKSLPRITDADVSSTLPVVLEGMRARNSPELQLASYMIISQIATRAAFSKIALTTITDTILKHLNPACFSYALLTLVHITQSQESYAGLSTKSSNILLASAEFEKVFQEITVKYKADRFLAKLLPSLCAPVALTAGKIAMLDSMIVNGTISIENIRLVIDNLIRVYLQQDDSAAKLQYIKHIRPLLVTISQRYTEELDTVLDKHLKAGKDTNELYEFASVGLKGTTHELIEEANTTLYLCLHSPAASSRLLALQKLLPIMDDPQNPLAKTSEVITSALSESLTEFNDLLMFSIKEVPDQLMKYVPTTTIISKLSQLLQGKNAMERKETSDIMNFLFCNLAQHDPMACNDVARLLALFAFSAPYQRIKIFLESMDATAPSSSQVLNDKVEHMRAALKKAQMQKRADCDVAKEFIELEAAKIASQGDNRPLAFWIELANRQHSIPEKVLSMLVLIRAVMLHPSSVVLADYVIQTLLKSLAEQDLAKLSRTKYPASFANDDNNSLSNTTFSALRHVSELNAQEVTNLTQYMLIVFANTLQRPTAVVDWFHESNDSNVEAYRSALNNLFRVFTRGTTLACFEAPLSVLISKQAVDDMLPFLMSIWTRSDEPAIVRARALQIASLFIKSRIGKTDFQHTIPCLFSALYDVEKIVRVEAIHCLENIRVGYEHAGLPSGHRLKELDRKNVQQNSSAELDIISAKDSYGQDAILIPDIKSNHAAHFIEFVASQSQEIIQDQNYIFAVVKEFIDLSMGSSDKQIKGHGSHILDHLLHHIKAIDVMDVRIGLLTLLDGVKLPRKLDILLPLLDTTLKGQQTRKTTRLIELLSHCFLPSNAAHFGQKSDKSLPVFMELLSSAKVLDGEDEEGWQASTRRFAIRQISVEFFANAKDAAKHSLFGALIDIATNGEQADVRASKKVLTTIDIPVKLFDERLAAFSRSLASSADEPVSSKRVRSSDTATGSPQVDLYELVTLLELIESITIKNDALLIKPLFDVLAAMINADLRDAPVSLEYISQLIMSSLTRIIRSIEENRLHIEESILRVDVVVQCIRTTGNPQTHNQALLLMATIASLYPESVLNNIMAVFTFMGANVLRQDDNYSFQVIQQTLEKIIPPMVESNRRNSKNNSVAMALQVKPIIKVFVGALFHIPKHRRLPLFTVLVRTLGENEFLYAIISLLLEKYANRFIKEDESDSVAEFCQLLSQQFSPMTQIKAINSLLLGVLALPNDKPEDETAMQEESIFDINEHSAKELRRYKLLVMNFCDLLLHSRGFLAKIMETMAKEENFEQTMQPLYLETIEILLKIVTYFGDFRDQYAVSAGAKQGVTKFWRGILKVVYDVMDKVNGLLPLEAFVNVVSHLIKHPETTIRRKAMNLFNEKVSAFEEDISPEDELILVNMVKELTNSIEKEHSLCSEEDSAINKQSALMCISSLAKFSGNIHPAAFVDAIPTIMGPECLQLANSQVKVTSLSCLATICQETGPRSVPHLPKFMPIITDILAKNVAAEKPNTMLRLAVVGALGVIVGELPHFMSPYLPKILDSLLSSAIHDYDESDLQKAVTEQKTSEVLLAMAAKVPPRVLLNPVFACYEKVVERGKKSVLALLTMVDNIIDNTTREVMTSHYKQLFKFFLIAFDLRRLHSGRFGGDVIDEIESAVISVFLDLVMKLNETLFKPLFLKVVDWALMELADEGDKQRVLFFYKLVDALLDRLKSIFAPYYNYVIDDVIVRLQAYISGDAVIDGVWQYIMNSLQKSFLYDNDNMWNAAKFNKILDPVVDQMMVMGESETPDHYLSRMTTYLVPCLGQMAVTVSNDTLWKPMNHKVLMKTREDTPEIRLAALKCLEEFYIRLGEEWLLFLAESISFLAELMEDDDVRVEKLVQQVNAQIEVHLGESLDKFFN
ncbi:hypothetical protein BX666DRAFT_2055891 [Dichotomocladium elegans]|nr:hypothetical protein BX666DRAFT_2055891 [Dichotomocladium elegans]